MRKTITTLFAAAILLALAVPVLAGGFFVLLGNPEASAQARAHHAFVTIKAAGCHQPEKAAITGTAIGLVDGRRQSVPLKLMPLSESGMYAVARQWPVEGRWVLQFVATDHDRVTTTVAAVGPAGIERQTVKYHPGRPDPEEVAALLDGATQVSVATK